VEVEGKLRNKLGAGRLFEGEKEGMLSTSFTMESGPRALSPTYTDCDRVIQDIYAMTRRRPYLSSTPRRQAVVPGVVREGRTRDGGRPEDLRTRASNGPVRTLQCGLLGGPTVGPVLGGPPVLGGSRLPIVPRASLLPGEVRGGQAVRPHPSMERRVGSPAVGTVRGQNTGLDLTRYGARGSHEPRASLDLSSKQPGRGSSTVRAGGEGSRRPVLRRGYTDLQLRDKSTTGLEASFAAMGMKDESRESKSKEESRISAIQARPLPPPVEPIYHSPLKPSKPPSPPSRRSPPTRPPQGPRNHYGRPQNQDQGLRTHYGAPRTGNQGLQSEYAKPRIDSHEQEQKNHYGKGIWNQEQESQERTSQPPTPRERPTPGLGPRSSTALDLVVGKSEGAVRRGLLWLQEDKLFSRWRERFIVLTNSHLVVHKKAASRISEMGAFLYKVPLASVSSANLEDRRGYLTLVVTAQREGKLLLRKTEGIREWQQAVSGLLGGGEKGGMATTREFWSRRQFSDCQGAQEWLLARQRTGHNYSLAGSEAASLAPTTSPYFLPSSSNAMEEVDSGLESMVTTTSDSSSNSSRSPPPPPPHYKLYTEL